MKLFKRKTKEKQPPQLIDIDNNPINEGDEVMSLRYELGKCNVTLEEHQYFYISQLSGRKVSYINMIDAITGNQKVKKLLD